MLRAPYKDYKSWLDGEGAGQLHAKQREADDLIRGLGRRLDLDPTIGGL